MDTAPDVDPKPQPNDASRHVRPSSGSDENPSVNSDNPVSMPADDQSSKQCTEDKDDGTNPDGATTTDERRDEQDSCAESERDTTEKPISFGDIAIGLTQEFLNAKKDAFGQTDDVFSGNFRGGRDSYGKAGTVIAGDVYISPRAATDHGQSRATNEKTDEVKSLLDLTSEFAPHKSDLSWLDPTAIGDYQRILLTERLLFIVSPDRTIARHTAWAVVEKMKLAETGQNRLLDFERLASDCTTVPDIFHLRKSSAKHGNGECPEVTIVIDAVDPRAATKGFDAKAAAKEFLWNLPLDTREAIDHELKQNHAYVLYLVDSADLRARLRRIVEEQTFEDQLKFSEWKVPFLRFLLKPHFADNYLELETKIRQRPDWPLADKQLFWKVKDLINKNLLAETLDAPAVAADRETAATIFTGNDSVQDTVAYVAAYFTGLNPREFQSVVTLLLGEKTRTVTVSALKQNQDGTLQKIEVPQEKALVNIWQESMDQVNRQCKLITTSAPDGTRTVDFADQRMGVHLRQYLEDDHGFFLNSQFARLFEGGLLFHPSARIGENMVTLTSTVVVSDPEYYLQQLVTVIELFEGRSDGAGPEKVIVLPALMLDGLDPSQTDNHFYQRIAALIRNLLEEPQRKAIVASLMEKLMRRKLFVSVLKVVRRLRLTPGFDEAHWLKQLFERGDSLTGDITLVYLYGYFRSLGPKVYQLVGALDSWIPQQPGDQVPSKSASELLRLFLVHCFETTDELDPKHYGGSPSRHPLFSFRDRDTAERNLNLLTRWLMHPWMKTVFSDASEFKSADALIATLAFQWSQVLTGQSGRLITNDGPVPGVLVAGGTFAGAPVSAIEVQRILISQFVANADTRQQACIITEWQKQSRRMMNQIQRTPYTSLQRNGRIWTRNLLEDLIRQFRQIASINASSRSAT